MGHLYVGDGVVPDALYLGSQSVDRVYQGPEQVWPTPKTTVSGMILSYNPYAYWPLQDPSGILFKDVAGNGHDMEQTTEFQNSPVRTMVGATQFVDWTGRINTGTVTNPTVTASGPVTFIGLGYDISMALEAPLGPQRRADQYVDGMMNRNNGRQTYLGNIAAYTTPTFTDTDLVLFVCTYDGTKAKTTVTTPFETVTAEKAFTGTWNNDTTGPWSLWSWNPTGAARERNHSMAHCALLPVALSDSAIADLWAAVVAETTP